MSILIILKMQSNKWGPDAWSFFHTVTFNYPLDPKQCDKDAYKLFFENLKNILPCSICRNSYILLYDKFPIDDYLEDRIGVTFWLYTLHNIINLKLNKKMVDFRDVILKYENLRARCGNIDTTDTEKLKECQKKIEWNVEMKHFYDNTIKKYYNITTDKISFMLKNNTDRDEIKQIIANIQKNT